MSNTDLPATRPDLSAALAEAAGNLMPSDYDDAQAEKPGVAYISVRQKPVSDEKGRIIRPPGAFRIGAASDLTEEDREELLVTILGFRRGRVYFRNLNDAKPTCKSDDMVSGSAARVESNAGPLYGDCATCALSKWGSGEGGRQACRENRRLFVVDWSNERLAVLTLGPSSLKGWRSFATYTQDQARKLAKGDKIPFIMHLLQVRATLAYRDEPAAHWVVEWRDPTALPKDLQAKVAEGRQAALDELRKAADVQKDEAGDYVGGPTADGAAADKDDLPF